MPTLRWLTRDDDVRASEKVPYRLLEEVPKLGYGDRNAGNMLIQGDNLEALKALLPYYAGQVKCIYIDPPYNTGSAFEHYDDNLEHSQWLAMMWPRLELLRELLAEDGSIWISIDDREAHYLKVIMDEVFGRDNFLANVVWQKRYSRENRGVLGDAHEHVLVYVKDEPQFRLRANRIPLDEKQAKVYRNPDNSNETAPQKRWRGLPMTAQGFRPNQMYEIVGPDGKMHTPPEGRCWSMIESEFKKKLDQGRIYWGKKGNAAPSVIRFLSEVEGIVPWTWWPHDDAGHTDESKKESIKLFGGNNTADTPKPERMMQRIFQIASNPGDLVLDSFLGSGTTAAVAQKMGRRYIGIEMGDHAVTHCAPRLQKVVDGEQGGISKAHGWQGGGGFRFYRLGPPVFTENGQIQSDIRFSVLAAHIWFAETGSPWSEPQPLTPFLGAQDGKGYALLYNGILGDKSVSGGNVLTRKTLAVIREAQGDLIGSLTIYGERTALSDATLRSERIEFKQTPYDVKARK
ncbi:adenine-specific DNA-methyltransferase [Paraperlucidibaca baekdonensis]|uniref:Adenine-specific DNA-methyltransferase n=1 Tax=Paraperlucidibaca baekdonensis TaxID=748120 RepID=A0A3E0H9D4_9GAMM|nr:site-specific DNA-methyltransferase [Paraperlucidibaca baekdonensis]REH40328.1 adenine-specific DNA-methyltransferase [Paraperlucidibaca baekdonensis]